MYILNLTGEKNVKTKSNHLTVVSAAPRLYRGK